jgi:hypothetical protein
MTERMTDERLAEFGPGMNDDWAGADTVTMDDLMEVVDALKAERKAVDHVLDIKNTLTDNCILLTDRIDELEVQLKEKTNV